MTSSWCQWGLSAWWLSIGLRNYPLLLIHCNLFQHRVSAILTSMYSGFCMGRFEKNDRVSGFFVAKATSDASREDNIFIITMTSQWARWRLKSPVSRLYTQPFIPAQMKENIKGLCQWNSPVTGEFPAKRASNAENVSIWWRHHEKFWCSVNRI